MNNSPKGIAYAFDFSPIAIYVYGWIDDSLEYDYASIVINGVNVGIAEKAIERHNVLLNYGNAIEAKQGFRFLYFQKIERHDEGLIQVQFYKDYQVIYKLDAQLYGDSIDDILNYIGKEKQGGILLISGADNKFPLIDRLAGEMKRTQFIVLNESTTDNILVRQNEMSERYFLQSKNVSLYNFPLLFMRNKFIAKLDRQFSKDNIELIKEKPFLVENAMALNKKFPNMYLSYSICVTCELYRFLYHLLDEMRPSGLMLWNEFYPYHQIIVKVCKEMLVPIIHCESGVLPGTLAFESNGQMGKSLPATDWEEFQRLSVLDSDMEEAERIITFLYDSRLNRWAKYNVYKSEQLEQVKEMLIKDRPVIFYAGQNDYESGLIPFNSETKKYHSPCFKTSYDAMLYLADICEKNNWNLIYKRHPMMRKNKAVESIPRGVINYDELEIHDIIDLADVTVTILSQTAYVALLRGKPVVMLGYNQLKHKGCCYEAFCIDDIEEELKEAIKNKFAMKQRKEFQKHVARLVKYYLYNDFCSEGDMHYGKNMSQLIEFINNTFPITDKISEG